MRTFLFKSQFAGEAYIRRVQTQPSEKSRSGTKNKVVCPLILPPAPFSRPSGRIQIFSPSLAPALSTTPNTTDDDYDDNDDDD